MSKKKICTKCIDREMELNKRGYSISTSSSMRSSFEGQVLCDVCGEEIDTTPKPEKR